VTNTILLGGEFHFVAHDTSANLRENANSINVLRKKKRIASKSREMKRQMKVAKTVIRRYRTALKKLASA
jgi:hypothetical protein